MDTMMKAAVVRAFGQPLVIEDRPRPKPGRGQVLVKIAACGVCHTDLHAAHGDWPIKPSPPFVPGHEGGPYLAHLALVERRLVFDIKAADGAPIISHHLSLSPFRRIVKDYELICDSYYAAIRTQTPEQIEAIDMGRRGLHDEAAGILVERLANKVEIDFDTARRLFTLIYALHWKG